MQYEAKLLQELKFKAKRGSGPGGQHSNKVSSKVELYFNLGESCALNDWQKKHLKNKLQNRLTKDGVLILQSNHSRSQHQNKILVVKRFMKLIKASLVIPKKRMSTKVPRAAIRKRIKNKKYISQKKHDRKKTDLD